MTTENRFEHFAICELFGHQKVAGKVTEQQIGGASFIRVDIPATENREAFTKFYHPNAVYAITPTTEEVATRAAHHIDQAPVRNWELKLPESRLELNFSSGVALQNDISAVVDSLSEELGLDDDEFGDSF